MALPYGSVFQWEKRFEGSNRLKALHRALKAGGTLGIVERRAAQGTPFRRMIQEGALTEEHVILLAEVAGFRLVTRSLDAVQDHMILRFVKP